MGLKGYFDRDWFVGVLRENGISIRSLSERTGIKYMVLYRGIKSGGIGWDDYVKCLDVLGYRVLVYRE